MVNSLHVAALGLTMWNSIKWSKRAVDSVSASGKLTDENVFWKLNLIWNGLIAMMVIKKGDQRIGHL